MSKKTPKKVLMFEILTAYNNFFEKIFEDQILTTSDQRILQKIYIKLKEIGALIGGLEWKKLA